MSKLARPFILIFDAVARLIAPLFGVDTTLRPLVGLVEALAGALDTLANVVIGIGATFSGIATLMGESFAEILRVLSFTPMELIQGKHGGFNFEALSTSFDRGFEEFLEAAFRKPPSREDGVVQQTVNVNKIEIANNFKEQQEPDRVAFTIKDQILKAAANPLSGNDSNFSLQAAF